MPATSSGMASWKITWMIWFDGKDQGVDAPRMNLVWLFVMGQDKQYTLALFSLLDNMCGQIDCQCPKTLVACQVCIHHHCVKATLQLTSECFASVIDKTILCAIAKANQNRTDVQMYTKVATWQVQLHRVFHVPTTFLASRSWTASASAAAVNLLSQHTRTQAVSTQPQRSDVQTFLTPVWQTKISKSVCAQNLETCRTHHSLWTTVWLAGQRCVCKSRKKQAWWQPVFFLIPFF